jgi:hypothetical protein
VGRHRRRERAPAPRPQEWPRRSPAHRATTGNRRVILALILAVLTVALVLGALVAITHGIITRAGVWQITDDHSITCHP